MVSTKSVRNVLRMVTAGKEEAPAGAPVAPTTTPVAPAPAATTPQKQTSITNLKDSYVYYFFLAPTDKAINFPALEDELRNDQTRDKLIENLIGGDETSTKYSAGHFLWKKLVIAKKSDKDPNKYFVYSADIDSTRGNIETATEKLVPANAGKTVDSFKDSFPEFFKSGSIVLLNSTNDKSVFYVRGMPVGNEETLLQTNPELVSTSDRTVMDRAAFERDVMDKYRIWTASGLLKPDFSISTNDKIEGRRYLGGKQEYENKIEKILKEIQPEKYSQTPQQPSLGDQERSKQQEGESRFSPVDEQVKAGVAPVQGQYIDTPVGGGRTMSAHNINSVRRVLLGYFKGAIDTVQPSTMNTTNTTKKKPLYVSDVPQENAALGATLTQYAKTQADLEKKTDQLTKNMAQRAQSMGRL